MMYADRLVVVNDLQILRDSCNEILAEKYLKTLDEAIKELLKREERK